jgi:hypothetical protein
MSTSSQTVTLNRFEPARIGWRQARGMPLDCDFTFLDDDTPGAPALATIDQQFPQLVFRPKSGSGASAYDLTIVDAVSGRAHLDVPGAFFSDARGYLAELYFRNIQGQPTRLAANGEMALSPGGAYQTIGPLFAATVPTGPAGPAGSPGKAGDQGQPGIQGLRGGTWTNGHGDPSLAGGVNGDQYLDVDSGNVWLWTGITWMQT